MIIALILTIGLLLIDQITKYIVINNMGLNEGFVVIPNLLEFRHVRNDGMAYGLFSGNMVLFYGVTIVAVIILGYFLTKINWKKDKLFYLMIVFLLAGAIGNFIDRLLFQYVIDFIVFPFLGNIIGGLGRFVCNIADIFLTVGIVLMFVWTILSMIKDSKKKKELQKDE